MEKSELSSILQNREFTNVTYFVFDDSTFLLYDNNEKFYGISRFRSIKELYESGEVY